MVVSAPSRSLPSSAARPDRSACVRDWPRPQGKRCLVSGSGNVAQYCVEQLLLDGATVLSMSDSRGCLHFPKGITVELLRQASAALGSARGLVAPAGPATERSGVGPCPRGPEALLSLAACRSWPSRASTMASSPSSTPRMASTQPGECAVGGGQPASGRPARTRAAARAPRCRTGSRKP